MQHSIATEEIWNELHGRLLAYIRGRVSSEEDATDILQDVFVRIHDNALRQTEVKSIAGWVYQVTSNAILDYHRTRTINADVLARLYAAAEEEGPAPDPDDEAADLARCLEPLLARIPEPYGSAVALTDLGDLTQEQAARQLGLSVSGMKSRVQRGRLKLKDVLLDCCDVELDRRLGVVGFEPRTPGACGGRDCGPQQKAKP